MKYRITTVVFLASMSLFAVAQDMPSMVPPEELKKLEWMLGEWTGTMNWTEPGMEGEMSSSMKVEVEGQFYKTTASNKMGEMTMTEVSYMGWDPKDKKFVSWTFTNFAPTPRIERGTFEGDKFVSVSDPWEVMGRTIVGRGTMTKTSDTEATFVLEFKEGDDWMKVADGKMKKKAKAF